MPVLEVAVVDAGSGGEAFGISQVAARAGVHETSIYRRWGSREASTDVRGAYWPGRLEDLGILFERAARRGEMPAAADWSLSVELLLAPLYFRLLITRAPLDAAFVDRLANAILLSVG